MRVAKPITEFRMVCANHGTTGHSSHAWGPKKTRAKVEESVEVANDHAAKVGSPFRLGETPYRIQTRTVTKWKDDE